MLATFLSTQVFAFLLIFCRVGSGVMLMSGVGETFVPPRLRLLFALTFSALLLPVLQAAMPALPASVFGVAMLIAKEIVIGIYLGTVSRILIAATHTAGNIIAQQTGLASAVIQDVTTQASQSTILTNLLSLLAITLFFAMDLHHVMLRGFAASYSAFAPGAMPAPGDLAAQMTTTVTHSFSIAVHLASPHIVIGLILYLGAGVLARLMPTMQIFFVLMAPQLMIGFFILMTVLPGMMLWYMGQLEEGILGAFPGR